MIRIGELTYNVLMLDQGLKRVKDFYVGYWKNSEVRQLK